MTSPLQPCRRMIRLALHLYIVVMVTSSTNASTPPQLSGKYSTSTLSPTSSRIVREHLQSLLGGDGVIRGGARTRFTRSYHSRRKRVHKEIQSHDNKMRSLGVEIIPEDYTKNSVMALSRPQVLKRQYEDINRVIPRYGGTQSRERPMVKKDDHNGRLNRSLEIGGRLIATTIIYVCAARIAFLKVDGLQNGLTQFRGRFEVLGHMRHRGHVILRLVKHHLGRNAKLLSFLSGIILSSNNDNMARNTEEMESALTSVQGTKYTSQEKEMDNDSDIRNQDAPDDLLEIMKVVPSLGIPGFDTVVL